MEQIKLPRINPNIIYPGWGYIKLLSAVVAEAGYHDHALLIKTGINALNRNVTQKEYYDAYMEATEIAYEFLEEGLSMIIYPSNEEFQLPPHLLIQQSQWKKTHDDIINQRLSHYYKTGM